MPDLELCDFALPADAKMHAGAQCVREPHEDGAHVVGDSSGGSCWLYEVDTEARTLRATMHADLRGPGEFSREEMAALYATIEASRS